MKPLRPLLLLTCLAVLTGCVSPHNNTPGLFSRTQTQLQQRVLETRTYETDNEEHVLRAAIGLLQDMGYTFKTCNEHFGLLTATALRQADNAEAQAFGVLLLNILQAANGQQVTQIATDSVQHIFATVVTSKLPNGSIQVRATFARTIYRTDGTSYIQRIEQPYLYQLFFRHLDQSLFLEGIPLEAPAA